MERSDIFDRLIDADKRAQELYDEALSYQATLAEDLSELKKELRAQMHAQSAAYIKQVCCDAAKATDEVIEQLDEQLRQDLNALKQRFENERENWANKMFDHIMSVSKPSQE